MKTGPAATTLSQLDRGTSSLIGRDVPECVAALESGNGPEIQVYGSPGLTYTLLGHYLIDELRVWAFPWDGAPELGDPVRTPGGSHEWDSRPALGAASAARLRAERTRQADATGANRLPPFPA